MAHTYVVKSILILPDTNVLQVTGTVDGVSVVVRTSSTGSSVTTALASSAAFQTFIQPLMLAEVPTEHPELLQTFTV